MMELRMPNEDELYNKKTQLDAKRQGEEGHIPG